MTRIFNIMQIFAGGESIFVKDLLSYLNHIFDIMAELFKGVTIMEKNNIKGITGYKSRSV